MKFMLLGLSSLLLVAVVMGNYGYDPIGSLYVGRELKAGAAWQYVLGAVEAMILYLVVWALVPWRPVAIRYACAMVCAWGVAEKLGVVVCRLQFPMDRPPPNVPLYAGLCDVVTGWPIYMITLLLVLLVTALRHFASGKAQSN